MLLKLYSQSRLAFKAHHSHSKRSASVLVRRATGRLVLSLVIANSCMPSSSATLACVLLLTKELRNNCQHKKVCLVTPHQNAKPQNHLEAGGGQSSYSHEALTSPHSFANKWVLTLRTFRDPLKSSAEPPTPHLHRRTLSPLFVWRHVSVRQRDWSQ